MQYWIDVNLQRYTERLDPERKHLLRFILCGKTQFKCTTVKFKGKSFYVSAFLNVFFA